MAQQPLTYDIGNLPTKQSVSALLVAEANLLRNTYHEVDRFYRTHAQLLASDQQKQNAGLDTVTYPDDATRCDKLKDIMFALKTFLEGNDPGVITGILDVIEQIAGMPG